MTTTERRPATNNLADYEFSKACAFKSCNESATVVAFMLHSAKGCPGPTRFYCPAHLRVIKQRMADFISGMQSDIRCRCYGCRGVVVGTVNDNVKVLPL